MAGKHIFIFLFIFFLPKADSTKIAACVEMLMMQILFFECVTLYEEEGEEPVHAQITKNRIKNKRTNKPETFEKKHKNAQGNLLFVEEENNNDKYKKYQ